jgi:broad specificity phosphatase PhoE
VDSNHAIDLLFVRHGEGEHMLDLPRSLDMQHPRLTEAGRTQVAALKPIVGVTDVDLVLASPTPRTLETARMLCDGAGPRRYVSPLVGPRMFPQNPKYNPLRCDDLPDPNVLRREFPEFQLHPDDTTADVWSGINQIPGDRFAQAARELLRWCATIGASRVIITSHDGTIHNYRELLGETNLTRATFLGPAGLHRVHVTV